MLETHNVELLASYMLLLCGYNLDRIVSLLFERNHLLDMHSPKKLDEKQQIKKSLGNWNFIKLTCWKSSEFNGAIAVAETDGAVPFCGIC